MPLRPATVADVPVIFALLRTALSAAQWSEAQIAQIVANQSPERLSLVIEENGSVKAFLAARCIAGECELENVVVAESVKRRGLAAKLIAALLEHARAQHALSIFLEVRASNSAARRLYEKFGFEVASRRPQYYRNPSEDAVIYRLELRESAS
jgi:ribosomal-protein-alanine N-acetyltransferase